MEKSKEVTNKLVVVEELRRAFDKAYADNDVIAGKLQSILSFSTIIVSIISAIEASTFYNKVGIVFWFFFIVALFLYLLVVSIILTRGLGTGGYRIPISSNWDELSIEYFHSTEEHVLDLIISEHLYSLELIQKVNNNKARIVQRTSILLIVIIIVLLAAIPIGLWITNSTLSNFFSIIQKIVL